MPYSLGQAAKAAGRTKATIQEAIKKGRISAAKDEFGRYQIEPAELHRVYPPIPKPDPEPDIADPLLMAKKDFEISRLQSSLNSMSELCDRLKGEVDWAKDQADHWRLRCLALEAPKQSFPAQPEGEGAGAAAASSKAEPSADTATAKQQESRPPKQGWLARLFGKSAA